MSSSKEGITHMATIVQLLVRKVSTDAFDVQCGQTICFVGGVLILVLGSWKLNSFDLTAAQLLCGLLLTSVVSLLSVSLGVLLPISHAAVKKEDK